MSNLDTVLLAGSDELEHNKLQMMEHLVLLIEQFIIQSNSD